MRRFSVFLGALAGVVLATAAPRTARAQDDMPTPEAAPADDFVTFPLVVKHDKHWVRAAAEVGAVIGVGFVDYLLNTSARGGTTRPGDSRWDYRYDWPTLRGKLTGADIALDSNKLPTNYASHPFAGTLYFTAARSNHLSFAESFLFAVLGSATWETFAEIRETTSVNDLVVTPVAGAAIGEATMQLAGFFDRGEKRTSNRLLSILFSPIKAIDEATDDVEPERTSKPDALGFPTEPWHRFVFRAGAAATSQSAASPTNPRRAYLDENVDLSMNVVSLPGYAGAVHKAHAFDDGNVSTLHIGATMSEGTLVDGRFDTRVVPLGFYSRTAARDEVGELYGHGFVIGLRIGFEYGMHVWDRDHAFGRGKDVIAEASPVGVAFEHTWDAGPVQVKSAVDLYGGIAGVTAYALSGLDSITARPAAGLPTALKQEGYYHAYAVTAAPSVSVALWRRVSIGARLRVDTFRPIEGADEAGRAIGPLVRLRDSRTEIASTLALRVPGAPLEVAITGARRSRAGDAGALHSSRTEVSALGSLGVVF